MLDNIKFHTTYLSDPRYDATKESLGRKLHIRKILTLILASGLSLSTISVRAVLLLL